jgi:hypothetical protein
MAACTFKPQINVTEGSSKAALVGNERFEKLAKTKDARKMARTKIK